jgi:membrane-bound lytic murein transglycosylase B
MSTGPNRRHTALALSLGWALPAAPARAARKPGPGKPPARTYAGHPGALALAARIAAHHDLPQAWVESRLAQAQRVESVRRLIMPPPAGTAKNWAAYRARFIEPQRIAAGLAFWQQHARWLDLAEERWGVPPEIIVGIVGVETFYGRMMGGFRVLDALATLSFDFPAGRKDRSAYFSGELEEFFILCAREGAEPTSLKGSYAGAMGLPQFMPGSINRYALDLDGDGHVRLHDSAADVAGSVAHYLAHFGWQQGLPTHHEVAAPVDSADRAALLGPDIRPSFTAAQMAERGAVLAEAGRHHEGPLALVELQNGERAPSYVAGTQNFYVLTRYNWSAYYAMAVIELAQALRQRQ